MAITEKQKPFDGSVLLLGGTGKVAGRIAPKLKSAGIPFLVASRSGQAPEGYHAVKFDWLDKATWGGTLAVVPPVRAVFIVFQGIVDPSLIATEFIDLAVGYGVKRFVFLSQSVANEGGPGFGQVHSYLHRLGDEGKISWAVLRPTWYQRAFTHANSIW